MQNSERIAFGCSSTITLCWHHHLFTITTIQGWQRFTNRVFIQCDNDNNIKTHPQYFRVVGLGGLGHMGVKIGAALGAHVTVISTSESKRDDAMKLGAKAFVISKNPEQMKSIQNSLDLVLDTVAAPHDVAFLIDSLVFEGVYCTYGLFIIYSIV